MVFLSNEAERMIKELFNLDTDTLDSYYNNCVLLGKVDKNSSIEICGCKLAKIIVNEDSCLENKRYYSDIESKEIYNKEEIINQSNLYSCIGRRLWFNNPRMLHSLSLRVYAPLLNWEMEKLMCHLTEVMPFSESKSKGSKWKLTQCDDSNDNIVLPDFIEEIGEGCFSESNVRTIKGKGVKYIAVGAFARSRIREIRFPNLIKIEAGAFLECYDLEFVYSPMLKEIEAWSFSECINLKKVSLPSLRYASIQAFANCSSLTDLVLPELVNLESSVLYNCIKLHRLTLNKKCNLIDNVFKYDLDGYRYLDRVSKEFYSSQNTVKIELI